MIGAEAVAICDAARAAGVRPDLRGAFLYGADLRGADLRGADLTGANLTNAKLIDANLTNAHLINANLINAKLTDANLTAANLYAANLYNANLSGAKMSNATLTNANLTDANFDRAVGIVAWQGGAYGPRRSMVRVLVVDGTVTVMAGCLTGSAEAVAHGLALRLNDWTFELGEDSARRELADALDLISVGVAHCIARTGAHQALTG